MPRNATLERRSLAYWRATFDLPPLNVFGPGTIPQLEKVVRSLESDRDVKVAVLERTTSRLASTSACRDWTANWHSRS
jgi:enoyl-CoA hydratase/carnithine racemase